MRLLAGELVEAYRHREQLWVDLDERLADCGISFSLFLNYALADFRAEAERAKAALEGIPGDVEETIARLEKKCKDMEKNSNSVASKQKMLKGLLERL